MPKGGATSLIPVSAGLRADLDTFLKAFLELRTIRFTEYKKLFQQRNMIELHNGRSESAEIIEFNEQLLIHCLPFINENVRPGIPRSLEERLFGLYSLYTFFYTQTVDHVVKIRVDPDNCNSFRKLMDLALKEGIFDAYMACLKLLEDKAFKHVAFLQTFDPSLFKQFGDEDQMSKYPIEINPNDPLARIKVLQKSKEFQKLRVMHNEYGVLRAKSGIDCDQWTMRTVEDVFQDLFEKTASKNMDKREIVIPIPTSFEKPTSLRSGIKEKAYRSKLTLSRSRRHRTTGDMEIDMEMFEFLTATKEPEPEVVPKKRPRRNSKKVVKLRKAASKVRKEDSGETSASSSHSEPVSSSSSDLSVISVKEEAIVQQHRIIIEEPEEPEADTLVQETTKGILRKPGFAKPPEIKRRITFSEVDEVRIVDESFASEASGRSSDNPADTTMDDVFNTSMFEPPLLDTSVEIIDSPKEPKDEERPSTPSGIENRDDNEIFRVLNISAEQETGDGDIELMDLSSDDEGVLRIDVDY